MLLCIELSIANQSIAIYEELEETKTSLIPIL